MKVDYISDTHLDFYIKELNVDSPKFNKQLDFFVNEIIQPSGGDVLVIAGDLGHYFNQNKMLLLRLKDLYTDIIIVQGNHDLYLVSRKQQERYRYDSNNRILEMKRFCKDNDIIYLDGDVVSIGGYTFGGVGMSWDKSYIEMLRDEEVSDICVRELYQQMNDSRLIFGGSKHQTISYGYGAKKMIQSWCPFKHFESEMKKLQNIEPVDVMISHYSPTVPSTIPYEYKYDEISTFYYFDGSKEIERINPSHWIYGHTHKQFEFSKSGVDFHCNPLGYPSENMYSVIRTLELK